MIATAAYAQNTANPTQGENGFTPLAWFSQIAEPALNGIHLSMSAWPNQPLGGDGRNWLRIQSTNIRPIPAAMTPAVCLSIAPIPKESSPQTARNNPPPITVRSTPGFPRVVLTCWLDRIACPAKNARKLVTMPVTSATRPNTRPFAANRVPRRGITLSDVLIIPADEWICAAMCAAAPGPIFWPSSLAPLLKLCSRWVWPQLNKAPMPMHATTNASSVQ